MKKLFMIQALLALSLLLPTIASANPFFRIIAFGDSLTDTGKLFELTDGLISPNPSYCDDRFANGPLWL